MTAIPDNDNNLDGPMIFIIIGKAYEKDGDEEGVDIHVMLRAPDDDTAVREALNALAEEGFLEADLDQIGTLTRCAQRRAACLRLPGRAQRRSGNHQVRLNAAATVKLAETTMQKARPDCSGRLFQWVAKSMAGQFKSRPIQKQHGGGRTALAFSALFGCCFFLGCHVGEHRRCSNLHPFPCGALRGSSRRARSQCGGSGSSCHRYRPG